MAVPQKIKNTVTYNSATPLLRIYPPNLKTLICTDVCTPVFTAVRSQDPPKCPATAGWVKKPWCRDTMGCHSAIRKDEIRPFATTRMDPESIMLSDMRQTGKTNKRVTSLICGI